MEMMEFLIEYGPAQLYWEPAEVFLKLSCVQLMLQLISIACNWKTYYARWAVCCSALFECSTCGSWAGHYISRFSTLTAFKTGPCWLVLLGSHSAPS